MATDNDEILVLLEDADFQNLLGKLPGLTLSQTYLLAKQVLALAASRAPKPRQEDVERCYRSPRRDEALVRSMTKETWAITEIFNTALALGATDPANFSRGEKSLQEIAQQQRLWGQEQFQRAEQMQVTAREHEAKNKELLKARDNLLEEVTNLRMTLAKSIKQLTEANEKLAEASKTIQRFEETEKIFKPWTDKIEGWKLPATATMGKWFIQIAVERVEQLESEVKHLQARNLALAVDLSTGPVTYSGDGPYISLSYVKNALRKIGIVVTP